MVTEDSSQKVLILHPFSFVLYPILFLYAQNIGQFETAIIIRPVTVALIATIILFLNWKLIP